jgi:hypothetical protein
LPISSGVATLAVLAQCRRLRVHHVDGTRLEGELDWAYQRRGAGIVQVLELTDEHGVALLDLDEVATIDVLVPPLRGHNLVAQVTQWVHNWQELTPDELQYVDLVIGGHDLLEVTVKRSRLACMPVRPE